MSENLTVVTADSLQGYATLSREEIATVVQMVGFAFGKITERAEQDGKDFSEVFQIVGVESLADAVKIEDELERNVILSRIKRTWTAISFMGRYPIPRELVLIDHVSTRACEELLKTQLEVINEEKGGAGDEGSAVEKARGKTVPVIHVDECSFISEETPLH